MLVPRCHHSHHAAALGSSASGALWPAFSQQVGTGIVAVHSRRMLDGHMSSRLYLEKKGIACGWKHFFFKSTLPMNEVGGN